MTWLHFRKIIQLKIFVYRIKAARNKFRRFRPSNYILPSRWLVAPRGGGSHLRRAFRSECHRPGLALVPHGFIQIPGSRLKSHPSWNRLVRIYLVKLRITKTNLCNKTLFIWRLCKKSPPQSAKLRLTCKIYNKSSELGLVSTLRITSNNTQINVRLFIHFFCLKSVSNSLNTYPSYLSDTFVVHLEGHCDYDFSCLNNFENFWSWWNVINSLRSYFGTFTWLIIWSIT